MKNKLNNGVLELKNYRAMLLLITKKKGIRVLTNRLLCNKLPPLLT